MSKREGERETAGEESDEERATSGDAAAGTVRNRRPVVGGECGDFNPKSYSMILASIASADQSAVAHMNLITIAAIAIVVRRPSPPNEASTICSRPPN